MKKTAVSQETVLLAARVSKKLREFLWQVELCSFHRYCDKMSDFTEEKCENEDAIAKLQARIKELEQQNELLLKERESSTFARITASDVYGNLKRLQDNLIEKYAAMKTPNLKLDLSPWIEAAAASRGILIFLGSVLLIVYKWQEWERKLLILPLLNVVSLCVLALRY